MSEWRTHTRITHGQCRRTSADQATSSPRASGRSPTLARPPTAPAAVRSLQCDALHCARTVLRCAMLSARMHALDHSAARPMHTAESPLLQSGRATPAPAAGPPADCAAAKTLSASLESVGARTERHELHCTAHRRPIAMSRRCMRPRYGARGRQGCRPNRNRIHSGEMCCAVLVQSRTADGRARLRIDSGPLLQSDERPRTLTRAVVAFPSAIHPSSSRASPSAETHHTHAVLLNAVDTPDRTLHDI